MTVSDIGTFVLALKQTATLAAGLGLSPRSPNSNSAGLCWANFENQGIMDE